MNYRAWSLGVAAWGGFACGGNVDVGTKPGSTGISSDASETATEVGSGGGERGPRGPASESSGGSNSSDDGPASTSGPTSDEASTSMESDGSADTANDGTALCFGNDECSASSFCYRNTECCPEMPGFCVPDGSPTCDEQAGGGCARAGELCFDPGGCGIEGICIAPGRLEGLGEALCPDGRGLVCCA